MNDRIRIVLVGRNEILGPQTGWLENHGHTVLLSSGLEKAQLLCEQGAGDVIVCDLGIAEDVSEFLRRRDSACGAPILLVASPGDAGKVSSALLGGAADYLRTPFLPEDLEQRCRLAYRFGLFVRENRRLRASAEGASAAVAEIPPGGLNKELRTEIPSLAAVERQHILDVLRSQRGNKARTAVVLGIHRRKLYRLLERLQISPAER